MLNSSMIKNLVKLITGKEVQKLTSILLAVIVIVFTSFIGWTRNAQADYFECYTGCSLAIEDSSDCKKSKDSVPGDYKIVNKEGEADVIVLAIHAGSIELNTGKIAEKIRIENIGIPTHFLDTSTIKPVKILLLALPDPILMYCISLPTILTIQ